MNTTHSELRALASDIFHLRSETMPIWIHDASFAWLEDRSGVPHLFVCDDMEQEPRQVTSGDERIQSLIGGPNRTIIVGADVGGNERQQLRSISLEGAAAEALTTQPDQIFEPYLVTHTGSD